MSGGTRSGGGTAGRRREFLPIAVATLLAATCLLTLTAAALAQHVRLQHSPALDATPWRSLGVDATLAGELPPERVASADVVVAVEDGGFRAIPLVLSRNALFGEIPGPLVAPPELRYYLRVVDVDGTVVTAPVGAPDGGLFVVPVPSGRAERSDVRDAGRDQEAVEVLSPLPGEVVTESTPVIAAVFSPPLEAPWDVLVTLDGENVTEAASVSRDLFVLEPADSLSTGAHRITFSALTPERTVEASWTFFVRERVGGDDVWRRLEAAFYIDELPPADWSVVGRVEVGWAVVAADTVSADSLDVFLPYDETSRPTVDLYASGLRGDASFLLTVQYNPVYNDDLDWFLNVRTRSVVAECGRVFPTLSPTTLDWASGLGAVLDARTGRAATKIVGMRMSEADTLAGFGVYSRFALGAMETFRWNDALEASLVYLSVFDREESVSVEQRLTDPLRNDVVAGLVRGRRGRLEAVLEYARSSASGETVGEGNALRARVGVEKDLDNNLHLEYSHTEPGYYSAGSFEHQPGESALELEFAFRPSERLRTSGWTRIGRTTSSRSTVSENELELRSYGRTELSWAVHDGEARAYVVGRHDRTPYESYDYLYTYGAGGGSWRRGSMRALVGLSWSRTRTPEPADTWSGSFDLRRDVVAGRWMVRAAGRWSVGSGEGESDYTRSHYTLESRWSLGDVDLEAEYWLVEMDDRADPDQSYVEHVVTMSLGKSF